MITHGSLFAGIGGFDYGFALANITTLWDVEIDPYCQAVIRKNFPETEIFGDIREVGKHNLKQVDILSGGFPCQDISVAGKQEGIDGTRSGLWSEFDRIIGELEPWVVVIENVSNLVTLGLERVLCDLAKRGYDAEWQIISANDVGAPHLRKRIWIVAYPQCDGSGSWGAKCSRQIGSIASIGASPSVGYSQYNGLSPAAKPKSTGETYHDRPEESGSPGELQGAGRRKYSEELADSGREHGRPRNTGGMGPEATIGTSRKLHSESGSAGSAMANAKGVRLEQGGADGHNQIQQPDRPNRTEIGGGEQSLSDTQVPGLEGNESEGHERSGRRTAEYGGIQGRDWWSVEPNLGELVDGLPAGLAAQFTARNIPGNYPIPRVAKGIPDRVNKLKGLGNAIVPQIAEIIGTRLVEIIGEQD